MDRPIPQRSSIVLLLGIYAALSAFWHQRPRPRARHVAEPQPMSSAQRAAPLEGIALRETAAPDAAKDKDSREASVPRGWWALFSHAASQWSAHKDARLGAALAYYSIFSIGPLIVVAIAVAGLIFGQDAVRGEVSEGLRSMLGESGAKAINGMLVAADRPSQGIFASVIGIGALIFAAIGVVVQVKDAMNNVWDVKTPPGRGLWGFARAYVLSFAGVLALGFLLLVSMLVTTALAAAGKYIGTYLPEGALQAANLILSFSVITILFAMMFKWLPDTQVHWRDVWLGAALTAVLFEVGKFLIGFYIGKQGLESTYGAAASLVIVLIWVYYSAQIVLFGAEITNVRAKQRRGAAAPQAAA
jgi:membrane protein